MIAYRVELWCNADGCMAGSGRGVTIDEFHELPGLRRNLVGIRESEGWLATAHGKHYCPEHRAEGGGNEPQGRKD